jgi:hypothetical protein
MANRENDIIRRTRRVVLAGVALLAFGLVGSVVWWRLRLGHEVNGRLRALQEAGLPTSGAELNKWYAAVPDSENAALMMTQAFALMRTFPDTRSNEVSRFQPPPRGQRLTPDQVQVLSDYIQTNAAALAKVNEALGLPQSRYPVDFSPGFNTLLPHLGKIKTLAQTYRDQALLAIDSGHGGDASTSLATTLRLARTLDEEPGLISQLVRIAVVKIGTGTLERRLNAGNLSAVELTGLASQFTAVNKTNLLVRALIGERAIAIPYFRMSRAEINRLTKADEEGSEPQSGPPLAGREPLLFRATGFFERDLRFYLQVMQTDITLAKLGPPRSLVSTNLNQYVETRTKSRYYILSGLLLPSLSGVLIKEAESLALVRISTTALAAELFRLANNRLPKDLHELVPGFLPSLPVDPFDGAPLRYKQLPKGYVIYSVGRDGHDDGGKEPPSKRRGTERVPEDITFTVER